MGSLAGFAASFATFAVLAGVRNADRVGADAEGVFVVRRAERYDVPVLQRDATSSLHVIRHVRQLAPDIGRCVILPGRAESQSNLAGKVDKSQATADCVR